MLSHRLGAIGAIGITTLLGCQFDESGLAPGAGGSDAGDRPPAPADARAGEPDGANTGADANDVAPARVYATATWELHILRTATDTLEEVGAFTDDEGANVSIEELAVDDDDRLIGLGTGGSLYEVAASSARAEELAELDMDGSERFHALAHVPAGVVRSDGALITGSTSGAVFVLDTDDDGGGPDGPGGPGEDDEADYLGTIAGPIDLTGDFTWLDGVGLVAAGERTDLSGDGDWLFRIDLEEMTASPIGATGLDGVTGLSSPGPELWGFVESGDIVRLDPSTGAVVTRRGSQASWLGAAGILE